jgi:DNA repair protein RadC
MIPVKRVFEHAQQYGIEALSISDLLALVLFGTGTRQSEKTLHQIQEMLDEHTSISELLRKDEHALLEYGFPQKFAHRLAALLELTRRLSCAAEPRYRITCPRDAANLVMPEMRQLTTEQLRVLVLDTKNQVLLNRVLYRGTVNGSILRVAEVFRPAIARNAPAILVCHNHPSNDCVPSPEDIDVTEQLVQAGKLLDIELVDSLIIGDGKYVSLKEKLRW